LTYVFCITTILPPRLGDHGAPRYTALGSVGGTRTKG
jgi:hypothetical protein